MVSFRASVLATTPYSLALAQGGSAEWRRTAISLEPGLTAQRGQFRLVMRAGLTAALVDVKGVGLTTNSRVVATALGTRESVSAGLDLGGVVLSLEIAASYWPGSQEVVVNNAAVGTLPKLEVQTGLGVEWEIRRVRPR
jgi:hypothetical protein